MAHEKWANAQIAKAIELGVNPLDAQRSIKWVLDHLPPGADPDTYIFPADALAENLASEAILNDVRAAWYGDENIPARFKRLLDASESS